MRCPKCRREIPFEATEHVACGWNVRPTQQTPGQKRERVQTIPAKEVHKLVASVAKKLTERPDDRKTWAREIVEKAKGGAHVLPAALLAAAEALRLNPGRLLAQIEDAASGGAVADPVENSTVDGQ